MNGGAYGMVTVKCYTKWGTNRKGNYLFSTGQGEISYASRKEKHCPCQSYVDELALK